KIQQFGLSNEFKDNTSEIGQLLKLFFGLPLLSPEGVEDCFYNDLMAIKPCCPKLDQFFDYVHDTYIMSDSIFPPKNWARFDKNIDSTTNCCESFHSKLNKEFTRAHPNIFYFMETLNTIQTLNYIKFRSNNTRKLTSKQQKNNKSIRDLSSLLTIRVPLYVQSRQGALCILLGFCDASQRGYAAVVYARILNAPTDGCVSLLGAKTKLAPLKALTVPRLELNAAVLLSRWLGCLSRVLESQLNIVGIHAWSDSNIVLSWLTVPHESFKTYVSNRVHQIHTLVPNCQWHHVDSANNPADCASLGIMPSQLAHLSLYWQGPSVVYTDTSHWAPSLPPDNIFDLPEVRPVVCAARVDDVPVEWFVSFSSFDRLTRVTARVIRFISCFRVLRKRASSLIPPEFLSEPVLGHVANVPAYLSKSELDHATRIIILDSQRVHFQLLRREYVSCHITLAYRRNRCPDCHHLLIPTR
ncbi:Integrase catalytic domain-containing protein, partial [Aphis craccivora]